MVHKLLVAAAWIILAVIVFATLSPIGFRPHLGSVSVERFGAFASVGLLFGLAYPKRFWLVLTLVVGTAVLLEAMQRLTPDRHGEIPDALVKFFGGVFGVGISFALNRARATFAAPLLEDREPPTTI
ncbi:MAG: VanZ family protein [Tardiphaga sp.]